MYSIQYCARNYTAMFAEFFDLTGQGINSNWALIKKAYFLLK